MRADIHDGPEHMLQSEAGYIDARPLTPARQNLLQRTAGPYIWVKVGSRSRPCPLPLDPQRRQAGPACPKGAQEETSRPRAERHFRLMPPNKKPPEGGFT